MPWSYILRCIDKGFIAAQHLAIDLWGSSCDLWASVCGFGCGFGRWYRAGIGRYGDLLKSIRYRKWDRDIAIYGYWDLQSGCEIGPFVADEGGGTDLTGTPATVGTSPKPNPSIYQFEWTGGNLTIEELLGNNGSGSIGVQVGLASNGLSSDNITLNSPLASVALTGNPSSAPSYVINNMNLAAGTYLLDNYLKQHRSQLRGSFAPVSSTPLPAALPLFAGGLGALGLLGWRRKRRAITA